MLKPNNQILFFLILSTSYKLFGQSNILPLLINDTTIKKFKIERVTSFDFMFSSDTIPFFTRTEIYDTIGRRIMRIVTNKTYWKLVEKYGYNTKRKIILKQSYKYSYGTDSTVTISDEKYRFNGELYRFRLFKPKSKTGIKSISNIEYDYLNRMIEFTELVGDNAYRVLYSYDSSNNLVAEKHCNLVNHYVLKMDSMEYNKSNQLVMMHNLSDYGFHKGKWISTKGVETQYTYDQQGLVISEIIEHRYLYLKKSSPMKHIYEYTFYK